MAEAKLDATVHLPDVILAYAMEVPVLKRGWPSSCGLMESSMCSTMSVSQVLQSLYGLCFRVIA